MTLVTNAQPQVIFGVVVEEQVHFTLVELERACGADRLQLAALVAEGVIEPSGSDEQDWRFDGTALRRARRALRLSNDFELSAANAAFVLELLDQIATLKARLHQAGLG